MEFTTQNSDRRTDSDLAKAASIDSDSLQSHSPQSRLVHRVRQRIQVQIPPKYSQEPIISTLANRYEIEVNIKSALLASNAQESGWFDLELYGTSVRLQQSLDYLAQLQIEIWGDDCTSQKDWSFS
jgi:ABC-type methionine transport system ATPase subunit